MIERRHSQHAREVAQQFGCINPADDRALGSNELVFVLNDLAGDINEAQSRSGRVLQCVGRMPAGM